MKPVHRLSVLLGFFAFCLICSASAFAQENADEAAATGEEQKQEKTTLTPGVVASFGEYSGQATVDVQTSTKAAGEEVSPIQASVQRLSGESCRAVIANASKEDSWSVRYRIIGMRNGREVMSKSFSGRLEPGEQKMHDNIRCPKGASMAVEIRSGKKIS